jgi:multiple sugar transport system ATP-binding protein
MEHFPMECDVSELLGHELVVYGYLDNQRLVVKTKASKEIEVGDVHQYSFDENKIHFFDPETAMRLE